MFSHGLDNECQRFQVAQRLGRTIAAIALIQLALSNIGTGGLQEGGRQCLDEQEERESGENAAGGYIM